jgi:hypothetical protein
LLLTGMTETVASGGGDGKKHGRFLKEAVTELPA